MLHCGVIRRKINGVNSVKATFWRRLNINERLLYLKICNKCGQEKHLDSFEKNRGVCKPCVNLRKRMTHKHVCNTCSNVFHSAKVDAKFCSRKCHGKSRIERVDVKCSYCSKSKKVTPSLFKRLENFYCNQRCKSEHLRTSMLGENNPNYSRVEVFCSGCSVSIKVCPHRVRNQTYIFCNKECFKRNIGKYFTGELNPNYNPNISLKRRETDRLLPGYKAWRTSVYVRDHFTCVACGDAKGGNLVAHHKNSWDKHPLERFDVSNGVALCESCHKQFHSIFGYGKNTKQQFETFITDLSFAKTR